ncbi:hypothetical protein [Candidatus Uabimicrobium sp. HlEnr_7]|uniref:hypothetical protein n=1 Tax=Candidatus Uabimicrobium helgolandensis TaxID=3095367 RepID=UPI003558EC66
MKKTRDDICAPPSPTDVLYGKIIHHNRIFGDNQLEMFLDELEYYHVTGAQLSLMDLIAEQNMLNPSQEIIIRETFKKHMLFTNNSFMEEALKFLPKAKEKIDRYVKENKVEDVIPCNELLQLSILPRRYYKILCCYMQHFWLSEENKILCDNLVDNDLITRKQLDELNKKYNYFIHSGAYKPLIFLLDSLAKPNILNLYLRAVRRSMITSSAIETYI